MTTTTRPTRRQTATSTHRVRASHETRALFQVRADDLPPGVCGRLEGVALTYGVVDAYGTRFKLGCLDRTKREKLAAGKVALYMDHDYGVRAHVGVVREMWTVNDGASAREMMRADLFDTEDGRRAKEYLTAVTAASAHTGLSIGFYDRESAFVKEDGRSIIEFVEVELEEISITPRPAVPGAAVTGVRAETDGVPDVFTLALRGIRVALGAQAFAALVCAVAGDDVPDADPPDAADTPEDADLEPDSPDADPHARACAADRADAEPTDTPEETTNTATSPDTTADDASSDATRAATMDERLAAFRHSYRST